MNKYVWYTKWYILVPTALLTPLWIMLWWLPMYALAMIPALLLTVIAIVFLAPRLAKADKFWTFIPANMAKIAVAGDEREGRPIRPLYNKNTHVELDTKEKVDWYQNNFDTSRFPKGINFKIGDVVPLDALQLKERSRFAHPLGLIESLWGITWVGIYPFRKVYCYDFSGTILRKGEGKETKDRQIARNKRWTTFLLQDETYVSAREEIEIYGNITILFWLATVLRGINPIKMAFAHHNTLDANFSQVLLPKTEEFCRIPPNDEDKGSIDYKDSFGWFSEERRGKINDYLHRKAFQDIHNRYGWLVVQNEMINLDPGKEYRDATTAKAREILQGEARVTKAEYDLRETKNKADGVAYTAEKEGEGQQKAIEAVSRAINSGKVGGEIAADLIRTEKIAKGQASFLVQAFMEYLRGPEKQPANRVIVPEEIYKKGD